MDSKRLQIRLTPAEWRAVHLLAADTGLSWSSLVRYALAELASARQARPLAPSPGLEPPAPPPA